MHQHANYAAVLRTIIYQCQTRSLHVKLCCFTWHRLENILLVFEITGRWHVPNARPYATYSQSMRLMMQDHITVNIGDGLMYCSDDRLKSNFHRIRAPNPGEYQGPRNTIAYFTNPNLNAVCQVTSRSLRQISKERYHLQLQLMLHYCEQQ